MSEILAVSAEWLALREPEDARARSLELALLASELMPDGPIAVHDLGSGTGSMMRWLAPVLPGPQSWFLHDWNARLTEQAVAHARPSDRDNTEISVFARTGNLAALTPEDAAGASLVTASALLDVLSAQEIRSIVDVCVAARAPAFFSLSVIGEVQLTPWDARDTAFGEAFNAHQSRDLDLRRQSGRHGASIAHRHFEEAGWQVRETTTQWRLDPHQSALLSEWFCGWVDAAVEQEPLLRPVADRYRQDRVAQMGRGELTALIDHRDFLAWPRP